VTKRLKSDEFVPLSIENLLRWIFEEGKNGSVFGIDKNLFFKPEKNLEIKRFGTIIETPIGVAAGPHSQLAQNIISAWLVGARYIELKTVQKLDELNVSKPCIDMNDEGYNCEWSQELKIKQSFNEYLKAWIIIHILRDTFGWNEGEESGFIFNMSVGYDLNGILGDKVQWFLQKMNDCSKEKEEIIKRIKPIYPEIDRIMIPDKISDNITLSTMHGCPPDEIEKIGEYLIESGYHTIIKLNPTLLGADDLRSILNKTLNFDIRVPDIAFEHDLKYGDAVKIIVNLKNKAKEKGVDFGLKLTNTLETENVLNILPKKEKMHYLSGRALHPIAVNLAWRLRSDFNGELDISFAGGADAFNIVKILKSGLSPVTVSSDILKPGGYGRLMQYIDSIKYNFPVIESKSEYLKEYAEEVLEDRDYKKDYIKRKTIKTARKLEEFDCIAAPCISECGTEQNIPEYMYHSSKGDFDSAIKVIRDTNPLPMITGTVCTRTCQSKCTRMNYDYPLAIRGVKKTVAENTEFDESKIVKADNREKCVAIIGAGPSGLSCAYYLKKEGVEVDIFEQQGVNGGMVRNAIPKFRLSDDEINADIDKILNLGIDINYNRRIDNESLKELIEKNDFVYLSTGAPYSGRLRIEGENSKGVYEPLNLLFGINEGKSFDLGDSVAVIGGGNTAMDVARSVNKIIGKHGRVVVLYRRKIEDMPADEQEIKDALKEGIEIIELVNPIRIIPENGRVRNIELIKMRVTGVDAMGRHLVSNIPNSELKMSFDSIIPAIGQERDSEILKDGVIDNEKVLIGGDAKNGASTIVNSIGDGRRAAEEILKKLDMKKKKEYDKAERNISYSAHMIRRSFRVKPKYLNENELNNEDNLTAEDARLEASRCLYCDEFCNICVTVCPNRANISYTVKPFEMKLEEIEYKDGKAKIIDGDFFSISQKYQVINIADFCNECGNCNTFCPTSGAPYKEKPKLCLSEESFENEERAYRIEKKWNIKSIKFKEKEFYSELSEHSDYYIYQTKTGMLKLSKDDFKILEFELKELKDNGSLNLKRAAIMKTLLENIPSYIKFN